jgi:hypothetical protein
LTWTMHWRFGTIDETKTKQPNEIGMLDQERIKEKKQRKWKVDRC